MDNFNILRKQLDDSKAKSSAPAGESLIEFIGNTPLVRLNRLANHLECEVWVKCEFMNPGGSIKDRIAKRMILEKVRTGEIKPGMTVIEASSGNTGIAVAFICAILGLKSIITLPAKNSIEKIRVMKALGATVVMTPNGVSHRSSNSNVNVAKRILKEIPNSVYLDQYKNLNNPNEHYSRTAEEIIEQCGGKIDMFVSAVGTGGTISGIARKLHERMPGCIVVGVDPEGSLMSDDSRPVGPYKVEGIGYDMVPGVFSRGDADRWASSNDKESFEMARKLIKHEGILCGGSSGAAVAAALKEAESLKSGQKCVVILPDSIRNYMSKFMDDDWLKENGFMNFEVENLDLAISDKTVSSMNVSNTFIVYESTPCNDAYRIMIGNEIYHLAVMREDGEKTLSGVVRRKDLRPSGTRAGATCGELVVSNVPEVFLTDPLKKLVEIFKGKKFAVVFSLSREYHDRKILEKKNFVGIVAKKRILELRK